jgi:hypothetical protein
MSPKFGSSAKYESLTILESQVAENGIYHFSIKFSFFLITFHFSNTDIYISSRSIQARRRMPTPSQTQPLAQHLSLASKSMYLPTLAGLTVAIISIFTNISLYLPWLISRKDGSATWFGVMMEVACFLSCGSLLIKTFVDETVDELSAGPGC